MSAMRVDLLKDWSWKQKKQTNPKSMFVGDQGRKLSERNGHGNDTHTHSLSLSLSVPSSAQTNTELNNLKQFLRMHTQRQTDLPSAGLRLLHRAAEMNKASRGRQPPISHLHLPPSLTPSNGWGGGGERKKKT